MTLLQMNYILEIDRCGSINKAAQRLFLSQSALSSAVQEVERELGITVFRRSNRGISLTEDGRELAAQIAPIVEQSRKLNRYYARRKGKDWVRLSVAAQRYPFCARAFVELLNDLADGPMQLSLKELDMSAVIREVALGESELGVIFVSDLTERAVFRALEESGLCFEPLVALKPHVFLRRDHPLAQRAELTIADVEREPLLIPSQGSAVSVNLPADVFGLDPARANIVCQYNLLFNAAIMVEEGMGIALCLDRLADTSEHSGLTFRPLTPRRQYHFRFVWKKYQVFTPAAELFLKRMKRALTVQRDNL